MIVHPKPWAEIGQPIQIEEIGEMISQILTEISCPCLSLSGGLDSSLILYYMAGIFHKVCAFTIGYPLTHPDITYSTMAVNQFGNIEHIIYTPTPEEIGTNTDESIPVKLFYKFLAKEKIKRIIACDGIDEFMAGYYDHQRQPDENTYYKFIRRLSNEHLKPLNDNSGDIKVYLPYLDTRLLSLLSQIPLSDKVDIHHRKKIMVKLAQGKIHKEILERWKYGFCDALRIKETKKEVNCL